jgi:hypothetical protein
MTQLYGASAATPGTAFGATRINGPLAAGRQTPFPIAIEADEYLVIRGMTATVSNGTPPYPCNATDDPLAECPFQCDDDAPADCRALHAQLDRAWGASPVGVWFDARREVRASLREEGDCTLTFDRLSKRRWLGWGRDAMIPLGAVGAGVSRLPVEASKYTPSYDTERYEWEIDATGAFIDSAKVTAYVENGIVTELEVEAGTGFPGGDEEVADLMRPFLRGRVDLTVESRGNHFWLKASRD